MPVFILAKFVLPFPLDITHHQGDPTVPTDTLQNRAST